MKNLLISKTHQTPEINFQTDGALSIKGLSTVDLVKKYYQPLFDWLEEFKNTSPKTIVLNLEIDYLNTSSSIMFVDLITVLNELKTQGVDISINWHYEQGDDDLLELGEHLQESSKTFFNFIIV